MENENMPPGAKGTNRQGWQRIGEAQVYNDSDRVFESYTRAFQKRFNIKPNVDLATDSAVIKDLVRKHGVKEACEIVETFVSMDGKSTVKGDEGYFLKRGHMLPLLRDNVNIVLVEMGERHKKATPGEIRIVCDLGCDVCNKYFKWVGRPQDLEARRVCPDCVAARL